MSLFEWIIYFSLVGGCILGALYYRYNISYKNYLERKRNHLLDEFQVRKIRK